MSVSYMADDEKRRGIDAMTTRVTVKNENQGAPYADWNVELVDRDGVVIMTLQPGESRETYLWHDGGALTVREVPK